MTPDRRACCQTYTEVRQCAAAGLPCGPDLFDDQTLKDLPHDQ